MEKEGEDTLDFIDHVANKMLEMEKEHEKLSERVKQGIEEGHKRIEERSQRFEAKRKERERHFDFLNRK
ncbi:hypothetical protein [Bacillus sp. ISL-57]|uniref:hypothetical protein n=1 Tax=Bacillus sp. ISL-57 TaxID=2819135 RepID=UPI001BE65A2F|nr:hypothetical protein [Bacillus sp. ISL-57]MBT2717537.1 hypothetical protein [Bacillus sp. ISL-57]